MSSNWIEQIQNVKQASTSINLTAAARAALAEIYQEVQSQGLLNVLNAASEEGLKRTDILDCAAYMLTRHAIRDQEEAIEYFRSVADVATQFPDLIYAVNKAKLTSAVNVYPEIPMDQDFQASLGVMLIGSLPTGSNHKLETIEQRVPLLKEMLRLYDNEHMSIQRTISINSLRRNILDFPYAPERPAHLGLRRLAFSGQVSGNEESREMLGSMLKRMLGAKPPAPAEFAAEIERLELNPAYLARYFERDLCHLLDGVHGEVYEEQEKAIGYLTKPEILEVFGQFRSFLTKHDIDPIETIWSLYTNKSPSEAQDCAERHPENRDYVAHHMIEWLANSDGFGDAKDPGLVFATQWLKSLEPREALELKLDDKQLLKLYSIRGENALVSKLKSEHARDKALGSDLGL